MRKKAKLPGNSEHSARKILSIVRAFDVRPGQFIMTRFINTKFLTSGGSAHEFEAGLLYAGHHGWLQVESGGANLYLTQAGFDAM
jgi:hypothetical protein